MCWLIFIGVSGFKGDTAAAIREHGLVVESASHPACVRLGARATKLTLSDGHCACALYVAANTKFDEDLEKLRARYRRLNWSVNKIERAVAAHSSARQRQEAKRNEFNALPKVVAALVQAGAEVKLLAKDFDGSFDTPFEAKAEQRVEIGEFIARRGSFPGETIVSIGASP